MTQVIPNPSKGTTNYLKNLAKLITKQNLTNTSKPYDDFGRY